MLSEKGIGIVPRLIKWNKFYVGILRFEYAVEKIPWLELRRKGAY